MISGTIEARLNELDWSGAYADLDAQGWTTVAGLLTHAEADNIAGLYGQPDGFRSHVVMSRHGFGRKNAEYSVT